ncbi:Histidine kinase [Dyadobacter soli]|uniref:Histidine kinase n=1 Tax=Dyadobacter soli TaxID=659014 RepID=A0A1G7T286_9BACT|nr:histidine kinase [Dyadobacter soli]SDG29413.1 Histidine kinase [Dyadobacter soli]
MFHYRPSFIEWLTLVCMFPIVICTAGYQLYGSRYFHDVEVFAVTTSLIVAISLTCWYFHFMLIQKFAAFFPTFKDMWKRVLAMIWLDIIVLKINMAIAFYGFDAVHLFGYEFVHENFVFSSIIGITVTVIGITLCETEYVFKKWKESLAMKELAQMQYHEQEFENLIRQINPHFLFNNLNTLSSLITTDPAKAEYFLDELSKVYRYLMRNNQEVLSTLGNEMQFIGSYIALLQIRHGQAIQFQMVDLTSFEDRILPSLSLQLLVENAVKHNMARKDRPLQISISVDGQERLVVENNLQQKPGNVPSNKIGLSNISLKYKMLGQPAALIEKDERTFRVRLALMHRGEVEEHHQVLAHLPA